MFISPEMRVWNSLRLAALIASSKGPKWVRQWRLAHAQVRAASRRVAGRWSASRTPE